METNELFKELRSDSTKLSGSDSKQPLGAQSFVSRGLTTNNSQYINSMHLSELHEDNQQKRAGGIADDFISSLEADFGIKSAKVSVGGASSAYPETSSIKNKGKADAR